MGRLWETLRDVWSLEGSFPLAHQPHEQVDAGNSVESVIRVPDFVPSASADLPGHSVSGLPHKDYPQLAQPIDYLDNPLPYNHSQSLELGMSIEQLLADGDPFDTMDGILDDELMSMWMATPMDIA